MEVLGIDIPVERSDFDVLINEIIGYGVLSVKLLFLFIVGYILGMIVSGIVKRFMDLDFFEDILYKYGTMTKQHWKKIVQGLCKYIHWFVVVYILSASGINVIVQAADFLTQVLWVIILVIAGVILGGIVYRIIKTSLDEFGVDEKLKHYEVADALGGISVTSAIALIAQVYVILLFVSQGVGKLSLPIIENFMLNVMAYVPGAILGLIILMIALIVGDFAGDRIKGSKFSFATFASFICEGIIIFFGITLALPKFGITDVSILTDSFKILIIGASIGLAIAAGLGLKDSIGRIGKKYEKEI